ncbi:hypothetical protein [Pedococcus bigeumensis]|uniref:4Fe-4S Wbl-type domain-containing protein n=1 Tax=Pedococcus bigeumensis TaxID=433644 RepID=A0A502CFQ8_9MICO|nr:hypothetical protein [Pedococcus bigeumensis]TPG12555.1 hypothetical protein EAH86_19820 [Pedococcus bigeumensis]
MNAAAAAERLTAALADLEDKGIRWPCKGRPEWTSESAEDREYAAAGCRFCPVFDLCAAMADETKPTACVYAGVDRTPKTRTKKAS